MQWKEGCFWVPENQGRLHREGHVYGVHHKCVLSRDGGKKRSLGKNTVGSTVVRNAVWQKRGRPEARPQCRLEDRDEESGSGSQWWVCSKGETCSDLYLRNLSLGTFGTCTVQVTVKEGGRRWGCCNSPGKEQWSQLWPSIWSWCYSFCFLHSLPPISSPSCFHHFRAPFLKGGQGKMAIMWQSLLHTPPWLGSGDIWLCPLASLQSNLPCSQASHWTFLSVSQFH